jgi:hypothetical protein
MEEIKKYIGDKLILGVEKIEDKTPIGSDMVNVLFDNGTSRKYPTAMFNHIVTEEPIDASKLRELKVDPIVNQTIVLLQESDIVMDDLEYYLNTLTASIDYKSTRANAKLYNVNHYGERSLLQIEEVIKDEQGK